KATCSARALPRSSSHQLNFRQKKRAARAALEHCNIDLRPDRPMASPSELVIHTDGVATTHQVMQGAYTDTNTHAADGARSQRWLLVGQVVDVQENFQIVVFTKGVRDSCIPVSNGRHAVIVDRTDVGTTEEQR